MPILNSFNGKSARAFGHAIAAGLSSFLDAFSSGSSLSSKWKTWTGSWSVASSLASTTTAASSYPLATVTMSTPNVTAKVKSPGNGSGLSLWVTDAGDWWSVVSQQDTSTNCSGYSCSSYYTICNGNCAAYYSPYTCSYACNFCVTVTDYSYYCCGYYYNYNSNACKNNGACGPFCYAYNCSQVSGYHLSCTPDTCYTTCYNYVAAVYCCASSSGCGGYSCSSYSTTYPRTIKLLRYASSTLSEITSASVSSAVALIKVIISGATKGTSNNGTITIKAYSDNEITQMGSDLVYNATGVKITTLYGIIATPGNYSESKTIDEISISRN